MNTYHSRKFVVCLLTLLVTALLQWLGKLDADGDAYMLIVLGVVGVYVTGNVKQKQILKENSDGSAQS